MASSQQEAAALLGRRDSQAPHGSLLRRSIHVMSDMLSPFSSAALASLPRNPQGFRARSTRADRIPDAPESAGGVRNYSAISGLPPNVRVPKKLATPIKVEGKVWLACERTWLSYLNMAILIASLSVALFNASQDSLTRRLSYVYALISIAVVIYGYVIYQRRITMIRKRDPDIYNQTLGPILISVALFAAVLVNFIIRVKEMRNQPDTP